MLRLLVLILLLAPTVAAQTSPLFTLNGQIRHRSEYDARDFSGERDPFAFHLLRTRLGVTVQPAPDVRGFVQVQDARFFGGEDRAQARGTLDGDADQLDLHQAYLAVTDVFRTGLGVRLGRQELAYANERIVGAVGWSNVGRSFDAAVLQLRRETFQADLFAAQLASPAVYGDAENFYGLYTAWAPAPRHRAEVFGFFEHDAAEIEGGPDDGDARLSRFTPGVFVHGTPGRFDYGLELIGQFGQMGPTDGAERQRLSAHLFSASAGYLLAPEHAFRLGLTYTRLSGDDDLADDTFRAFNTLFATNHKFYGFMDYFPALAGPSGLQDAFVSLSVAATPQLGLALDVHHFASAVDRVVDGEEARTFGQEADLTASYRYNGALGFALGASAFWPGTLVEATRGDDTTFWAFVQTTLTF